MQLVLIVKSVIENWGHKYVWMRNKLILICTRSACVVSNPVAFTVSKCLGITVYSIVTINHSTTTAVCLTLWGGVTYRCVGNLIIIVAWPIPSHYLNHCWNIVILAFRNQLQWSVFKIQIFLFKKMHLKMPSAKYRSVCLGLNMWYHYSGTSWCRPQHPPP